MTAPKAGKQRSKQTKLATTIITLIVMLIVARNHGSGSQETNNTGQRGRAGAEPERSLELTQIDGVTVRTRSPLSAPRRFAVTGICPGGSASPRVYVYLSADGAEWRHVASPLCRTDSFHAGLSLPGQSTAWILAIASNAEPSLESVRRLASVRGRVLRLDLLDARVEIRSSDLTGAEARVRGHAVAPPDYLVIIERREVGGDVWQAVAFATIDGNSTFNTDVPLRDPNSLPSRVELRARLAPEVDGERGVGYVVSDPAPYDVPAYSMRITGIEGGILTRQTCRVRAHERRTRVNVRTTGMVKGEKVWLEIVQRGAGRDERRSHESREILRSKESQLDFAVELDHDVADFEMSLYFREVDSKARVTTVRCRRG